MPGAKWPQTGAQMAPKRNRRSPKTPAVPSPFYTNGSADASCTLRPAEGQVSFNGSSNRLDAPVQPFRQAVDEADLAPHQLAPCGLESEPPRSVDLRELPGNAGARRPFQRERVAPDLRDFEVTLQRPGRDALAARLAVWAITNSAVS